MASSSRPPAAFSELEVLENAGAVVRNTSISNLLARRFQSALRAELSVTDTSPGKYECWKKIRDVGLRHLGTNAAFSEPEVVRNTGAVARNVRISNLLAQWLKRTLRSVLSVPNTSPDKYEC